MLFFKNHAGNELGRLISDHFLFFTKALYEVYISIAFNLAYNIKKLYKTLDY